MFSKLETLAEHLKREKKEVIPLLISSVQISYVERQFIKQSGSLTSSIYYSLEFEDSLLAADIVKAF